MNFTPDHPDWTAYALNELPEEKRPAFDAEVAKNPEARAFVESIQRFGDALSQSLQQKDVPSLNKEQRAQIQEKAKYKPAQPVLRLPFTAWGNLAAAAALMAVVFGGILMRTEFRGGSGVTDADLAETMNPSITHNRPLQADGETKVDESVTRAGGEKDKGLLLEPIKDAEEFSSPAVDASDEIASTALGQGEVNQAVPAEALPLDPRSRPLVMKGLFAGRSTGGRVAALAAAPAIDAISPAPQYGPSLEDYNEIRENLFRRVDEHPLSTFSIDVDTASYANIRRFLKQGQLPPKDAVRIEEMLNYFSYRYPQPEDEHPFAAAMEMYTCPWNSDHQLLRIGIKGKELQTGNRPACNLVFLLDVSGSMQDANKLPLVQRALKMLVNQLDHRDRVAIVVYAGASGLVLPSTACDEPQAILDALERLRAGGSTNGGAGIELAYKTAFENRIENGVNRVILCTDGDFNVGTVQSGDLVRMIEEKAKGGVFLSVLGFGMGNYKDGMLEQLADKGNGNYAYVDSFSEARKVLVDQLTGTLVTIAKDVKIQVEFNPAQVAGYRLIGYENRMLRKEDFNDDTKDAGEIGAGHTVTALYELVPAGQTVDTRPAVDPLKYQPLAGKELAEPASAVNGSAEWLTLKLRYKQPEGDRSVKMEQGLSGPTDRAQMDEDFLFASAVAEFGLLLRESEQRGDASFTRVIERARQGLGEDRFGYRREFLELVRNAQALKGSANPGSDPRKPMHPERPSDGKVF